ncbi:MAG: hypothetical protein QW692_02120 [Nitrososphaerota archaeon]
MSAPSQLIRVDSETYERLRRLRDERGCSFSKLLMELLEHAEASGNSMPERCPKCGHDLKLDSSRGEPHILLGSIGIEIYYDACPKCLWPLEKKLSWKPIPPR